ncbi:MAG: hypothetical protein QME94_11265 [Anaerolineae bacterium]|nr:hypothetical protein [Anaerolineae bacterium]
MVSQSSGDIEDIYFDYLREARRILKEQRRVAAPYAAVALALLFGGPAIAFAALLSPPSGSLWVRAASWALWIGIAAGAIVSLVGGRRAKRHASEQAGRAAETRPGFLEFFRLVYSSPLGWGYWPRRMVTGKKYERFLSIIGRKGSAPAGS